jgi:hypothetical protein
LQSRNTNASTHGLGVGKAVVDLYFLARRPDAVATALFDVFRGVHP